MSLNGDIRFSDYFSYPNEAESSSVKDEEYFLENIVSDFQVNSYLERVKYNQFKKTRKNKEILKISML